MSRVAKTAAANQLAGVERADAACAKGLPRQHAAAASAASGQTHRRRSTVCGPAESPSAYTRRLLMHGLVTTTTFPQCCADGLCRRAGK
jgi:hypothetical protein